MSSLVIISFTANFNSTPYEIRRENLVLLNSYLIEYLAIQLSKVHGGASGENAPQRCLDSEKKTVDTTGARNEIWVDVRGMDCGGLTATESQLGSAAECAMVLIFADQSSQLREQKVKGRRVMKLRL